MIDVIRENEVAVVLMHMQGLPKTMQAAPSYREVVSEVIEFLRERCDWLVSHGVDREAIAVDPGFGFGKRLADNIQLMRNLEAFHTFTRPLVFGVSPKSRLGQLSAG